MGIFDDQVQLWQYHRATLKFRNRIMGAIPSDPKVIEAWLAAKSGITAEAELQRKLFETLQELGHDVENLTPDEAREAIDVIANDKRNTFKRNNDVGLYIEGRIVKAMLRECINILYAGEAWGRTRKGPKAYAAERVFVVEDVIPLGRSEADGTDITFGHVTGPQGPRSTVGYHDYCDQPEITFHIMSQRPQESRGKRRKAEADNDPEATGEGCIRPEEWAAIWSQGQEIGLGAQRSMGAGRFDIIEWTEVKRSEIPAYGRDTRDTLVNVLGEQEAERLAAVS